MDQDGLWNYGGDTPTPYRVIGFAMTFPGTASVTETNWNRSITPQSIPFGDQMLPPPNPSERVLVAGAVLSERGQNNPSQRAGYKYANIMGGFTPLPHKCAHLVKGYPAGDNVAMLDGSAKWREILGDAAANGFAEQSGFLVVIAVAQSERCGSDGDGS